MSCNLLRCKIDSSMSSRTAVLLGLIVSASHAAPFSARNTLFGTAEKNGPMIPHSAGELLVFNHTCNTSPCVITQLHVPSIYPGSGCAWDWESGMLRMYIDGESSPSIALTLLQLASVGAAGAQGNAHKDISPFAAGHLFGKNAQTVRDDDGSQLPRLALCVLLRRFRARARARASAAHTRPAAVSRAPLLHTLGLLLAPPIPSHSSCRAACGRRSASPLPARSA